MQHPAEQLRCHARARLRALFVCAAVALAFAAALLVPVRAFAAIVPACEHDAVTRAPVVKLESSDCDSAADADRTADNGAAPICDEQGASAVAPPRLLPIVDARIEAGSTCTSTDAAPMCGPRSGEPSILHGPAVVDHATLGVPLLVKPAPFVEIVDLRSTDGGPLAGFAHGVYHPPR